MRTPSEQRSLEATLVWLKNTVLPGYERLGDVESVRQTLLHIADVEWLLEDPRRKAPGPEWTRHYAESGKR
jgi:hypothetical protein